MEVNKIYNEDCLVGMQRIPAKTIDAVICDLPYGVLNRSNQQARWDPGDTLCGSLEAIRAYHQG